MDKEIRKAESKNLLIYLGITFAISWLMFFSFLLPGNSFLDENGSLSGTGNLICTLGMLCPAIGVIITRYITKEGHALTGEGSMMLGIDLKNGKFVFYILALLLPWLYTELGYALTAAIIPEAFDKSYFKTVTENVRNAYMYPLMAVVSGVFFSIGGLGEELGWRGYMMPKLIKMLGMRKAVVAGGIIWGIWHWPLTYAGHNFGTGYKGYPYAGFAAMCVFAVFTGILLTVLTVRTGSVWPAAFMHAVNNGSPSVIQFFISSEKKPELLQNPAVSSLIHFIPMIIISVTVLEIHLKAEKKAQRITVSGDTGTEPQQ